MREINISGMEKRRLSALQITSGCHLEVDKDFLPRKAGLDLVALLGFVSPGTASLCITLIMDHQPPPPIQMVVSWLLVLTEVFQDGLFIAFWMQLCINVYNMKII